MNGLAGHVRPIRGLRQNATCYRHSASTGKDAGLAMRCGASPVPLYNWLYELMKIIRQSSIRIEYKTSNMVSIREIQAIPLFQNLSSASRQSLAEIANAVSYVDGQIILQEGDEDKPAYFILQGTVRIYRSSYEGREQTLSYLEKGAAFNLPPVFSDSHRTPASAAAVGVVRVICFAPEPFRSLVGRNAEIAMALLRDLSEKLERFTNLAHDLSLRSVRARLARFLLEQGRSGTAGEVWTQEKIAAQIGTVREVVSRTMRAFVREGLVRMERQKIRLLDEKKLEEEAESG